MITAPDDLIFRTRNGTRPSASNWGPSWHRALKSIGHRPLRVYDCRHAAATTWLQAGYRWEGRLDGWVTASKPSFLRSTISGRFLAVRGFLSLDPPTGGCKRLPRRAAMYWCVGSADVFEGRVAWRRVSHSSDAGPNHNEKSRPALVIGGQQIRGADGVRAGQRAWSAPILPGALGEIRTPAHGSGIYYSILSKPLVRRIGPALDVVSSHDPPT